MKPILMNQFSVKATLEGRKSQTRWIIKPQPEIKKDEFGSVLHSKYVESFYWKGQYMGGYPELIPFLPYGKIGDRLWVRETWCSDYALGGQDKNGKRIDVIFKADDWTKKGFVGKWKPSIFMPKKYSRITLEITDIRVEKIKDISEYDCRKEGLSEPPPQRNIRVDFKYLWNSINKKHGYGWDVDPYVWVLEFKVVK